MSEKRPSNGKSACIGMLYIELHACVSACECVCKCVWVRVSMHEQEREVSVCLFPSCENRIFFWSKWNILFVKRLDMQTSKRC